MTSLFKPLLRRILRKPARLTALKPQFVRVNGSTVFFNADHLIYIREYYTYCVATFRSALESNNTPINLVFGNYDTAFDNDHPVFRIDLQYEHTLVKQGGRDSRHAVAGRIPTDDGRYYLVRLINQENYRALDFIIEYSIPNILNMASSGAFGDILSKCGYIAPLLYAYDRSVFSRPRPTDIITTFNNPDEPRRKLFLDKARSSGITISNVTNTFSHDAVGELYASAAILVNIRQTEHHHTFEELRVLPALLRGCVVISEHVPLEEAIPYGQFIIWSTFASLIDTIRDVERNYERYRSRLASEEFFNTIRQIGDTNYKTALSAVRLLTGPPT